MEKFSCEKLYIKLSKFILGVHKKSSNFAVLEELGRYPLYITFENHDSLPDCQMDLLSRND